MVGFKELKENFKKYVKFLNILIADKRIPRVSKILLGFCLFYFFSPIDLIPDFIPLIGQLDDLIIVPTFAFIALRLIPKSVYEENYKKVFGF